MIKCPSCGKKVQGTDLVGGICSNCHARLSGDESQSVDSDPNRRPFNAQVRDSSTKGNTVSRINPAVASAFVALPEAGSNPDSQSLPIRLGGTMPAISGSDLHEVQLANAATFVSEQFVDASDSEIAKSSSASSHDGVGTARSDVVDSASLSGSGDSDEGSPHEAQRPDTNFDSGHADLESSESAATCISGEIPGEILKTDDLSMSAGDDGGERTIVVDDGQENPIDRDDAEAYLKTFVVEMSVPAGDHADADKTFVSDEVPEELLKTIESIWGALDEGQPSRPDLLPDSPRRKSPDSPQKHKTSGPGQSQSLVIKTKAFVDNITSGHGSTPATADEPEYELLKVLGEGGMGIVFDARQTSIDRNVAVKMLKAKTASNKKQRAKFLAEAVVTGDLDHPNIVPIYDVGANTEGALFYSMKKVQGTPWLKVIREKSLQENLEVLMKIADAVGFAHARGVVHRDLKPENVMLGEFGEVLVMDWGLAQPSKTFRKSRSITETNTMGGTPAYMAPEMATGPIDRIVPASDVYLLGAILYEILTGTPPHVATNAMKCLMAAARNEIAPTEKTGELVDIAMRAMATNVEDRYCDVKSFQAAIRDYQSHSESVLLSVHAHDNLKDARRSENYETYSRAVFGFQQAMELWSGNRAAVAGAAEAKLAYAESAFRKRDFDLSLSLLDENNPDHAALRGELREAQQERIARHRRFVLLRRMAGGLVAAVFLIVIGASIWIRAEQLNSIAEAKRANIEADRAVTAEKLALIEKEKAVGSAQEAVRQQLIAVEERNKAELAKRQEEYESYVSKIGLAASQIDKNAFDAARGVLDSCKPDLRNWEWGRLMHLCSQSSKTFVATAPIDALAVDSTGGRFATGGWDGTASIRDRVTGEVLQTCKHQCDYVHAVAFSPDGRILATGSNAPDAFVQIWDCETGKRLKVFTGHSDAVLSVAFSKDGRRLLTGSYDKTARLWDVETGAEIRPFRGHSLWVLSAAFSADETRVVTAGQDGTAIVFNVNDNERTPPFAGHRGPVCSAVFAPDGKSVVSAGYDRRILIWKPDETRPYDFKRLADAASTGETAIVPPAKYRELDGHTDAIRSVRFSSDGTLLVSSGQDNTVRVWDFHSGTPVKCFRGHGAHVTASLFLPDGRQVLSASHDDSVREWSISGNEELRTLQGRVLEGHVDAVLSASFSRDQRRIVTASRDRSARTWDASSGQPLLTLSEGHSYLASTAVFFPDGRRLLTAAVDNTTRIWDVTTGGQLAKFDHTGRAAAIAMSGSGRRIATGGDNRSAQILDSTTFRQLKQFPNHVAEVSSVAFSPDESLLATGDLNGHVRLWNIESGELTAKFEGHSRKISAIAFLDGGSRLVTASGDNTVGQWEIATGKELAPLVLKHPDAVLTMQVVPGTELLVTSCGDRILRLWNAANGTLMQSGEPFAGEIHSISISADGQRLIAANSESRTVHLVDVAANREVLLPRPDGTLGPMLDLKRRGGNLWSVAFHPASDDVLTVGGSDARLWDMKAGRLRMSFSQHGTVAAAGFSPDGTRIATGSWDNSAKIWDAETGHVIRKLEGGHTGFVNSTVFSSDGSQLLTSSDDGTARIWNIETGQVIQTLTGHTDRVRSATFSPDGTMIVTASNDKTARLWRVKDGEFLREFRGHKWGVVSAEFVPDGKRLVTGSEDNSARIWNLETAEELHSMVGHTASITSVAVSPDGLRIVTGSQDHSAKLWDATTGVEILTLLRHTEDVTSVSFSPDGRQILSGSRDGTAVIWLSKNWIDKPGIAFDLHD